MMTLGYGGGRASGQQGGRPLCPLYNPAHEGDPGLHVQLVPKLEAKVREADLDMSSLRIPTLAMKMAFVKGRWGTPW